MSKQTELEKIKNLLKVHEKHYILCHFRGVFTLIANNKNYEISASAVKTLLKDNPKTEIIHFSLAKRKWSLASHEFEGPIDPIPEVFAGRDVHITECDSPEIVKEVIRLRTERKVESLQVKECEYDGEQCIAPGSVLIIGSPETKFESFNEMPYRFFKPKL